MEHTCVFCEYEPKWGAGPFRDGFGACRWPCPPCLTKLMRPVDRKKLFVCPAFEKKKEQENG